MPNENTFSKLRSKVEAYRKMEDTVGKDRKNLTLEEKLERKKIMIKALGLEKSKVENSNIESFDPSIYRELLEKFFAELGTPNVFTDIQIADMPKGMYLKIEPPVLYLEKAFLAEADANFAPICIFHELYHKFGQNMNPDMKEVKYMGDYFGQQTIIEMDIDADTTTFNFMEKQGRINFKDYLGMIYDGLSFHHDEMPRIFKVARFIGSMLSTYFASNTDDKAILYPYINKINEGKIIFACIAEGRKYAKADIAYEKTQNIINLYQNASSVSKEEFIRQIDGYCAELFAQIKPQLVFKNKDLQK